jgi:predicted ester cyclase
MESTSNSNGTQLYNAFLGALPPKESTARPLAAPLDRNKRVVERIWDELVNGRRSDALDELVCRNFVDHAPLPGLAADLEGLRQRLQILHRAFPDFHSTIIDLVAEGDKVVAFVLSEGTHQGDFAGVPATGRRFSMQEIQILRIADGKMVEHWQVADLFGMFVQLGLAKSPW